MTNPGLAALVGAALVAGGATANPIEASDQSFHDRSDSEVVSLLRRPAHARDGPDQTSQWAIYMEPAGGWQEFAQAGPQEEVYGVSVTGFKSPPAAVVEPPAPPSLTLSGNNRWVVITTTQDLQEAIKVAGVYAEQKSRVVTTQSGGFVVVMGPYPTGGISSFRRSYKGPPLPSHIALTRGAGYVETVWLPGAEVPASAIDQAAVDAAPNQFEDAQAADQGDNATAVNPLGQAETEPAPTGSTSADPVAKQPPLESLVLSGVTRWVAVASVQDLNQAIVIARVYEQEKSRVVRSQNGWFAVILGPYAASSVSDFRRSYVGPELPSKILLTRGTGYVETVWRASTATAASETADQSTVGAIERLPRDTNAADGQADSAKALKLLRPLAERGYEGAENSLGLAYASGAGVPQDYVLAHMWFNLAGAQGNEDAIRNRDNIAKAMTPDQIAEAQRLAREWRPGPKPAIQE